MSLIIGNNTIALSDPIDTEQFMETFFGAVFDGVTAGTVSASKAVIADSNGNVAGLGRPATILAAGATKALVASQNNNIVQFNTAAGSVVTLPAASGSGVGFRFYVSVLATSNSHIIYTASANGVGGSDVFVGLAFGTRTDSGNAVLGFAAASTSNTITLNRTTTGSVNLGEYMDVTDVATNKWLVSNAFLSSTGAAFATPFSHT